VRFGDKVYEPVVEEGDADVIIAFERLEALRYAHFLKKDGTLVVNDCRIDPMTVVIGAKTYPENILDELKKDHKVYSIDGQKIALELGNSKVLNSVVLGYAAEAIGFDKDAWLSVVESTVPAKTVEINKKAFIAGYEAQK
jgi:indolepyruvate ferredoxin oxidoreductase beta subunit